MKSLINQSRFLKAVEYTSENFFSKPYSISPMVDRWFNQLSMVELVGKKRPIHLTEKVAKEHVDIILDGSVVDKAKIDLIIKFHSQKSTHEKDRIALVEKNLEFAERWKTLDEKKKLIEEKCLGDPTNESFKEELVEYQRLLDEYNEDRAKIQTTEEFDKDKIEAKQLFDDIAARGTSLLNVESFEKEYRAKIKKVVHRPNHGLAHSVRAAYSISAIEAYRTEHGQGSPNLKEPEVEKLQLMMLFSVVGRKDETGFADARGGRETYESFRTTSGREYLKYIEANGGELYADMESRYRDAIVVELMGYGTIDNAIYNNKIPELLLDYVIKKEGEAGRVKTREEAFLMVQPGAAYSLDKMFPSGNLREKASDMLGMMDDAHGLELTRCYPLYPKKDKGSKSVGIIDFELARSGFTNFTDKPSLEKFTSFFKLMRNSFDTMKLTGQNTMFGMLSEVEFEAHKSNILQQVEDISNFCKDPLNKANLLAKAKKANAADSNLDYFTSDARNDDRLLADYRRYLITRAIAERIGGIIENYLGQSALLQFKDAPASEKLDEFFKLMGSSYSTLPGKTILTQLEYDQKKADILLEMQTISDDCKDPQRFGVLVADAKIANAAEDNSFTSYAVNDKDLLRDYRNFLIASAVVKSLTGEKINESLQSRLNPDTRMFEFQQVKGANFTEIDHHQNAVKIVQALQTVTPYTGVTKTELPVILAVKHDRPQNKIKLTFESDEQAKKFQETYKIMFGHDVVIMNQGNQFTLEVNRTHYKQLLTDHLIEFKQVEVPKTVNREDDLIDDVGQIDALSLIAHSRGLGRLVSTTALGEETFPDYDYLLKSFDDPVHSRYSAPLQEIRNLAIDRARYRDPRSGAIFIRTEATHPIPAIRFQEPVTEPKLFKDKVDDGWTLRAEGGKPKNTIFTKKLAHTLIPSHGKVVPFSGYLSKASIYFPIGVLSDVDIVDIKDGRYVWAQNMETTHKTWIRDASVFNKQVFRSLHAELDDKGRVIRSPHNVAALDHKKIEKIIRTFGDKKEGLVDYLKDKAAEFMSKMNEKHYRPTDENLDDFKRLIKQQKQAYLSAISGKTPEDEKIKQQITDITSGMIARVNEESLRKGLKYSMSLRELIKHQNEQYQKDPGALPHNEILASNTKGATRALYASKDELFDRLNLALHAMKIKEKYGYDVPLLVVSQGKSPYNYTEAMIKNDMQLAHHLIRKGKFPYDKTLCKVYEMDDQGKIKKDGKGQPIIKVNDRGKEIQVPKSVKLQQEMLVDLFKVGLPELKDFKQLTTGKIGSNVIGDSERDVAINTIATRMDVIGSLKRETTRMEQIFAKEDVNEREKFFLRAVALGHQSLVEIILAREDFTPTVGLLKKGVEFSKKNNHKDLSEYLSPLQVTATSGYKQVAKQLAMFKSIEGVGLEQQQARVDFLLALANSEEALRSKVRAPELADAVQNIKDEVLLNQASRTSRNQYKLPEFIQLLAENKSYRTEYANVIASGNFIQLGAVTDIHKRNGSDIALKFMKLISNVSFEEASNYIVLKEINSDKAEEFFVDKLMIANKLKEALKADVSVSSLLTLYKSRPSDDGSLKELLGKDANLREVKEILDGYDSQKEADFALSMSLLGEIRGASLSKGEHIDEPTEEFCSHMEILLDNSKDHSALIYNNLQKIRAVHQAVTSGEMLAVTRVMNQLERPAKSYFSSSTQGQADKIRNAIINVPLLERAAVLSDSKVRSVLPKDFHYATEKKSDANHPPNIKENIGKFTIIKQELSEIKSLDSDKAQALTTPKKGGPE